MTHPGPGDMWQAKKVYRVVDPEHQQDLDGETPGQGAADLTGARGIASWLVREIVRGSLAHSEIGVALLRNQSLRARREQRRVPRRGARAATHARRDDDPGGGTREG